MARARNKNLPPLDEYAPGSAMAGLTEQQRLFVAGKVWRGLTNADAARAAGYTEHSARHNGTRIAQHPGIQVAIEEESRKLLKTEGPRSILTLVEVRDNSEAPARDRIKASVELMNRAGLHPRTEHTLNVEHHDMSEGEKDREILRLARELGLDETTARKMLIAPDDMKKNAAGVYELPPEPVDPEVLARRENKRRSRANLKLPPEERESRHGKHLNAYWEQRLAAEAGVTDAEFSDDLSDVL
jgi:hypothetical protein